jgi:hypothetical protein
MASLRARLHEWKKGEFENESRVGYFHHELHPIRHQVRKEWVKTTAILCLAILGCLSLFWGSLFTVNKHLGNLDVWIVDLDGGIIGQTVVKAAQQAQLSTSPHISYRIKTSFDDATAVRLAVYEEKAFSAIVINRNASDELRNANASYNPFNAAQTIYVEARDQSTIDTYIVPALTQFEQSTVAAFAKVWIPQADVSSLPVQAISPAIAFQTVNLRRFGPTQVTPAVSVGLIYLIIIAFFSYSFFLPTHGHFIELVTPHRGDKFTHRRVYYHHMVIWKWLSTFTAYFFMSLSYSLVSLCYQIPFSHQPYSHTETPPNHANGYGRASFFIYWMTNFLGMNALGFACENVAMVVGNPFTALWLVFWVISNVCTAFYPLELASGVYRYGLFFPLYNVVKMTRVILFDTTKKHVGRYIGILVAWLCVNTLVFPFAARFLRWKVYRGMRKAAAAKEAERQKELQMVDEKGTP